MTGKKHILPAGATTFCSTTACLCGAKNDYQACCRAVRDEWKIQQGGRGRNFGMEAHHILCIESMSRRPKGEDGEKLDQVLMATAWCINAPANMIALPKFGHTIKWYSIRGIGSPPSWKNHPQHDIHHNNRGGYRDEIARDLSRLWTRILREIAEKNCELSTVAIAESLNDLSRKWRGALHHRGSKRQGGTHAAWKRAKQEGSFPEWVLPFSMASDAVALELSMGIRFDDRHARKFKQLVTAMSKGASP